MSLIFCVNVRGKLPASRWLGLLNPKLINSWEAFGTSFEAFDGTEIRKLQNKIPIKLKSRKVFQVADNCGFFRYILRNNVIRCRWYQMLWMSRESWPICSPQTIAPSLLALTALVFFCLRLHCALRLRPFRRLHLFQFRTLPFEFLHASDQESIHIARKKRHWVGRGPLNVQAHDCLDYVFLQNLRDLAIT